MMLHTQYLGPVVSKKRILQVFPIFACVKCDLQGRAICDPRGIILTNLVNLLHCDRRIREDIQLEMNTCIYHKTGKLLQIYIEVLTRVLLFYLIY